MNSTPQNHQHHNGQHHGQHPEHPAHSQPPAQEKPAEEIKKEDPVSPAPESAAKVADDSKKQQVVRYFTYGFVSLIILAIIVVFGYGAYRAQSQKATDAFTIATAKMLNLKAAKFDNNVISYADYADDFRAIKIMWEYDKSHNGPSAAVTSTDDLSDQVLFRQVNNIMLNDLARKYDLTVEKSDIDDVKKNILEQQFKTMEEAEKAIQERYGWSLDVFTEKVIKPFVLQGKLEEKVKSDPILGAPIEEKAQDVLNQIKGGANFADMAKKYGQDGTSQMGGDLGWFAKGAMVPEFEAAAFSLKKGQLNPKLVSTTFGYHIIKVTDKKTERVKDSNGKYVNQEMVKASHILFMWPSLNQILGDTVKNAKIEVFHGIHNPFLAIQNAPAASSTDSADTATTTGSK